MISLSEQKPISMNERILSLIFAFTFLKREVTGEELREIIPAYSEAPSFNAWERMFSRDKKFLKDNGYPLKTTKSGYNTYYSLDNNSTEHEIELSSREAEYICEIAGIWDDRFALKNLRNVLSKSGQLHLCSTENHTCDGNGESSIRIKSISPFAPELLELMIAKNECVEIDYEKYGSNKIKQYIVIPLQFTFYSGNWYFCAIDIEDSVVKTFRADRIVSIGRTIEINANLPEQFSFDEHFDYLEITKNAKEGDLVE